VGGIRPGVHLAGEMGFNFYDEQLKINRIPCGRPVGQLATFAIRHPRLLVGWLQAHAMGELELTATQIRVAEILLRKCLPDLTDLQQTDLNVLSTRRYVVEVPPELSEEEWEKKYSLPMPNSLQ
jgi:hypothetical protein